MAVNKDSCEQGPSLNSLYQNTEATSSDDPHPGKATDRGHSMNMIYSLIKATIVEEC